MVKFLQSQPVLQCTVLAKCNTQHSAVSLPSLLGGTGQCILADKRCITCWDVDLHLGLQSVLLGVNLEQESPLPHVEELQTKERIIKGLYFLNAVF